MFQVDTLAAEECFRSVGNTYYVQLEPVLLHQFLALAVDLLDEASAHRSDTADEEVEHLVFGKEERVVDDVERLAERLAFDYERNVRLRSTLRTGYHVDTVTSQRAEQLACDARRVLHVLAYNGYRSQVLLRLDGRDFTHFDFFGKLFAQHGTSQVGVGIAHTDGGGVFRRRLRHEEHADAVLGQRLEDAVVYTDDAYHTQTLNRNQRGVVDGRDTLDGLALRVGYLLLDDGSFAFGIEGVLDEDWDILMANGVDSGRIDYLGAEVAQLRGLHIAQLVDGVGGGDDARIGGHEAVHIGPYLQRVGIEGGGDDGCRIVGATSSQVGHIACRHVGSDEAGYQRTFGQVGKSAAYQSVGQFLVEYVLGEFLFRLDELA